MEELECLQRTSPEFHLAGGEKENMAEEMLLEEEEEFVEEEQAEATGEFRKGETRPY